MTINIHGRLLDLSTPCVMAIINATPDSFYPPSRIQPPHSESGGLPAESPASIAARHIAEGATILDIGACSTRPGSAPVSEDEELRRIDAVLPAIRTSFPNAIISIDTFRSNVVRHCAANYAIDIINDVSAGCIDPLMFQTAADLHLPYILTHGYAAHLESASPTPLAATSHANEANADEQATASQLSRFFAKHLATLHELGVADVILDPGIGFGKTSAESFAILHQLPSLIRTFHDYPWLIGLSRKRIIFETLANAMPSPTEGTATPSQPSSPATALNGTTVLNTVALLAGAHIIRVHDTRPAMEAITLLNHL